MTKLNKEEKNFALNAGGEAYKNGFSISVAENKLFMAEISKMCGGKISAKTAPLMKAYQSGWAKEMTNATIKAA